MQTVRVGRQVATEVRVASRKLYLDLVAMSFTLGSVTEQNVLGWTQEWARHGGVQYEKPLARRVRPRRVALA